METHTLLLSFMTLIVVGITILIIYQLVVGGAFSSAVGSAITPQKTNVTLVNNLHSGQDSLTLTNVLPLSMNETGGIEYSFAAWIVIDDYAYGTSGNPVIFVNGTASPSVSFDINSNVLYVKQNTYTGTSITAIRNMPSEKLFHLVVTVTQTYLDIYVNGLLHTHKTLDSLPLQSQGPVQVGPGGGWKGKIGSLVYYNYALSAGDVRSLSITKAKLDPNDLPPNPPYFDTSWWIGRPAM